MFLYQYVWMYTISQWNPCVHCSFWNFFLLLISCGTTTINCNFIFWMTYAKVFWNKLLLIYYRWSNWNGDGDLKEDLKFSYLNISVYVSFKFITYFVVVGVQWHSIDEQWGWWISLMKKKSKKSDIVCWVLLFWDRLSKCKQRWLCCVNDMISNRNSSIFVCWVNNFLVARCWWWCVMGWIWAEFSWLQHIGQSNGLFSSLWLFSSSSSHAGPRTSTRVLCCRSEFKN